MHGLHKFFLSTSKIGQRAEQVVHWWKGVCVLFYLMIVLREGNQAQSELFSKNFSIRCRLYPPSACQFVHGIQKKDIIYAWIMHRWIVYRELARPLKTGSNVHICVSSFQTNIKIIINKTGIRFLFQMWFYIFIFWYIAKAL